MSLFPGNYEIRVTAKGLQSAVQKVALKAGDNPRVSVALQSSNSSGGTSAGADTSLEREITGPSTTLALASYDEIYPAGPGKAVAEQVCIICHGENFLPSRPATEAVWNSRIEHMAGGLLRERDAATYAEGLLSSRTSVLPFSRQDRAELLAYMTKNFGPDAKPRGVRSIATLPSMRRRSARRCISILPAARSRRPGKQGAGLRQHRLSRPPGGQDVRFDHDGNVWLRTAGIRIGWSSSIPAPASRRTFCCRSEKRHPRSAGGSGRHDLASRAQRRPDIHGETSADVQPEDRAVRAQIPMDPDNTVRNSIKWLQSLAMDSKGNIYVGWIMGGALSKWERATNKVTVYRVPTPHSIPYGIVADRNDNIWMAQWSGGKLAKFDTSNNQWTNSPANLSESDPAAERRLEEQHLDRDLGGGQTAWQAGKAGSDYGQVHRSITHRGPTRSPTTWRKTPRATSGLPIRRLLTDRRQSAGSIRAMPRSLTTQNRSSTRIRRRSRSPGTARSGSRRAEANARPRSA